MADTETDNVSLFIDALSECERFDLSHDEAAAVDRWSEFWAEWFVCRYSDLREQFQLTGGFGDNDDGPPDVYTLADDMLTNGMVNAEGGWPTASLESIISSFFEIKEPDEAEAAIRAAVERGIAKGRQEFDD